MRSVIVAVAIAVTACGGGKPSRDDCARVTAQLLLWGDLDSIAPDLAGDIPAAQEPASSMTAKEAWAIVKNHDLAEPGAWDAHDGLHRVDDCVAHRSSGEVECMLAATSLRAAQACVTTR